MTGEAAGGPTPGLPNGRAGGLTVSVTGVTGIGEITEGTDLAALVRDAVPDLADGDVVVVTSKAVSKAEARVVAGTDREAAVEGETVRVVARRGSLRIVETRHGLVTAAAGVDASNVPLGSVALLPVDPDASARRLRERLATGSAGGRWQGGPAGVNVGVVVTDTGGRTWRDGVVDIAIGLAGVQPAEDLRGRVDSYGNPLTATVVAVADEVAAASELVRPKLGGVPVAVVRGMAQRVLPPGEHGPGAAALVRGRSGDLFPLGSRDVLFARRTVRQFASAPVDHAALARAAAAAAGAPAPHHTTPWRFVLCVDGERRSRLLAVMRDAWRADLRGDGLDDPAVERRVDRGRLLDDAPALVVPCLVPDGAHTYPDGRRSRAEEAMFLVSAGAGIEHFLLSLAVDGLGSAWIGSTLFCADVVVGALDLPTGWRPLGAVAIGHPVTAPPLRDDGDGTDLLLVR